mmetsp:Transcript_43801/g.127527  ORF Transcript_43801/g.127527 Transcript_43801/m.127527 type:complete len:277 (+) Transcript_43801:314-1144(+)
MNSRPFFNCPSGSRSSRSTDGKNSADICGVKCRAQTSIVHSALRPLKQRTLRRPNISSYNSTCQTAASDDAWAKPHSSATPCDMHFPPRWRGPRHTKSTKQCNTPKFLASRTAASASLARMQRLARSDATASAMRERKGQRSSGLQLSGTASNAATALACSAGSRCKNSTSAGSTSVSSWSRSSGGAVRLRPSLYTSLGRVASGSKAGRSFALSSWSCFATATTFARNSSARLAASEAAPKSATLCSRLRRASCSFAMRCFFEVPRSEISTPLCLR